MDRRSCHRRFTPGSLLSSWRRRVKGEKGGSVVGHPDEVDEAGAGGENVGGDDRGKYLIAKRLRVFGSLGLLMLVSMSVVLVLMVLRLEHCSLLMGLKIELGIQSLEGKRTSVIVVETDEET